VAESPAPDGVTCLASARLAGGSKGPHRLRSWTAPVGNAREISTCVVQGRPIGFPGNSLTTSTLTHPATRHSRGQSLRTFPSLEGHDGCPRDGEALAGRRQEPRVGLRIEEGPDRLPEQRPPRNPAAWGQRGAAVSLGLAALASAPHVFAGHPIQSRPSL
jgi:hypothetical protein